MRTVLASVFCAAICAFNSSFAAAEISPETDREVQYLLTFVATSGCSFKRNGSTHDPADAADHLRLKYRRGARYVSTAEHFIDRLASESSWTGRDYSATCDGEKIPTGQWLHQALDDYRAMQKADSSQP